MDVHLHVLPNFTQVWFEKTESLGFFEVISHHT